MNDTMVGWVQVIATFFIAATFVIDFFQLRAMNEASAGQNILAFVAFLQSPDVRDAKRRLLLTMRTSFGRQLENKRSRSNGPLV